MGKTIMLNRELFFISIILMFIVSIGAVSASDVLLDDSGDNGNSGNGDIILDDSASIEESDTSGFDDDSTENENNEGNIRNVEIIQAEGETFEDIQNAILIADENCIIKLNGTYLGTGNYIYINKNLTLEGENAVLDAKGLSGIIVSENEITLKNIIFKNSNMKEAVYIEGNANLVNCTFESNKIRAIRCVNDQESGNVNIRDSIFKNNYMVLDSTGMNLIIENSTFSSNKVTQWSDAVFKISDAKNHPSKVSISNSSFISNSGLESVFYFALTNSASSNIFNNCLFNKNKVDESGVIYLYKGILTIKDSVFGNNTRVISTYVPNEYGNKNKLTVQNTTFDSNGKYVLDNDGNCSIDSCTFKNNKNDLINNYNILSIKNSKFLNNKGAVNHFGYDVMKITNSTFTNSSNDVAAIYSQSGKVNIKDCSFKSNSEAAIVSCNQITITKNNSTKTYKKAISFTNGLNPFSYIKYSFSNLTTSYKSGKTFNIKAVYGNSKKVCSNLKFKLEIFSGNDYVDQFFATANSKGIASFKISRLDLGSYNAVITCYSFSPYDFEEFTSVKAKIKIKKANTIVKAPKFTAKFKKSKYFKVTIKNKASKKAVSGIKVKIKVYTGKKYKTYTVKTNKNGLAKLNTKTFKRGKHKVVISSGNNRYIITKKSSIIIK